MPENANPTIVLMGIEYRLDRCHWGLPAYCERGGTDDMFSNDAIMEALRNLPVPLDAPSPDGDGSVVFGSDGGFSSGRTIKSPKKTPTVKES